LNELRSSQDFSLAQAGDAMSQRQLASDVYFLQDAMKAALINGDLYTNLPNTKSPDWVNRVNNEFFSNWRDYAAAHSDQIGRINAFERENGLSGQADVGKFSALLDSPNRFKLVLDAQQAGRLSASQSAVFDAYRSGSAKFTAADPTDMPRLPGFSAHPSGPTVLGTPILDPNKIFPPVMPGMPIHPSGPTTLITPALDPNELAKLGIGPGLAIPPVAGPTVHNSGPARVGADWPQSPSTWPTGTVGPDSRPEPGLNSADWVFGLLIPPAAVGELAVAAGVVGRSVIGRFASSEAGAAVAAAGAKAIQAAGRLIAPWVAPVGGFIPKPVPAQEAGSDGPAPGPGESAATPVRSPSGTQITVYKDETRYLYEELKARGASDSEASEWTGKIWDKWKEGDTGLSFKEFYRRVINGSDEEQSLPYNDDGVGGGNILDTVPTSAPEDLSALSPSFQIDLAGHFDL